MIAVSYTHLDVYKRQSSYFISYFSVISFARLPSPVPRMIAVSRLVCIFPFRKAAVSCIFSNIANNVLVKIILLDDAFQHRYVKAGLNILLTDYHRLFCDDTLMPAGRLRESAPVSYTHLYIISVAL